MGTFARVPSRERKAHRASEVFRVAARDGGGDETRAQPRGKKTERSKTREGVPGARRETLLRHHRAFRLPPRYEVPLQAVLHARHLTHRLERAAVPALTRRPPGKKTEGRREESPSLNIS